MKRHLMAIIVLWTSSYINVGIAPVQEPIAPGVIAKIRPDKPVADPRQAAIVMASFAYHASASEEKIPLAKSKSD